jgi:hypothetical protein
VTKELTQMHDMNVFCPIEVESLTYDEKKENPLVARDSQGEEGQFGEGAHVR